MTKVTSNFVSNYNDHFRSNHNSFFSFGRDLGIVEEPNIFLGLVKSDGKERNVIIVGRLYLQFLSYFVFHEMSHLKVPWIRTHSIELL
jgi:hypothetical protein